MKLKCEIHDKRVMVIDKKIIHRQDGTRCNGNLVTIGYRIHSVDEVESFTAPTQKLLWSPFNTTEKDCGE